MRLPFDFTDSPFGEDARIKFSYTSPELHQNIEISLDGDQTSVIAIMDAFQRFLGALGVSVPPNVVIGFIEMDDDEEEEDDDDDNDDIDEEDKD